MNVSHKRNWSKQLRFWGNELIFVGPMLLAFIIVKIVPLILSVGYSLTDWNGISKKVEYIGFGNFKELMGDTQFWYSLRFTLLFTLVTVVLSNIIAFVLAYYLSKPLRGRNLMRAGYYLPNTLGGLVLGFVWSFIFILVFPRLYEFTGIALFGYAWTATTKTSFWAMVIVQVWVKSGYLMLLYIAGFTALPEDCIESALIDGASPFQMLRKVIIPLMMTTITRCLFLSILTCMRIYEINLALTEGGPFRSSESITMNIYITAFTENRMGYGSAKALVFIVVVVVVSGLQTWLTSRKEVEM